MSEKIIKQYQLLVRHCHNQLNDSVNEYIQNGWKPYGPSNMSVWHDSDIIEGYGQKFSQAMIKEEQV